MSIKLIAIGIIAIVLITLVTGLGVKIYTAGKQAERTAALTKGVELVHERDQLNVQVRSATPADICTRLGGKWVPDNGGECD